MTLNSIGVKIFRGFARFLKKLNEKGFSTQDVAIGMTMAVLASTVATVTGNSILLDTEERLHVFNAQTMAQAIDEKMKNGDVTAPDLEDTKQFSLQFLYDEGILETMIDASGDEAFYHATSSVVVVKNSLRIDGSDKTENSFFVRLVNDNDDYNYVNETDPNNPDPVKSTDLTRDNISIPKRDTAGK
ncbi:MAG: hypothetical protein ACI9BD_000630 [Candidatus Marinamargulisbacteria bacterium]|jgi:hypothetical protein